MMIADVWSADDVSCQNPHSASRKISSTYGFNGEGSGGAYEWGTALEAGKVAGLIPDYTYYDPGFDSASKRNEY